MTRLKLKKVKSISRLSVTMEFGALLLKLIKINCSKKETYLKPLVGMLLLVIKPEATFLLIHTVLLGLVHTT